MMECVIWVAWDDLRRLAPSPWSFLGTALRLDGIIYTAMLQYGSRNHALFRAIFAFYMSL